MNTQLKRSLVAGFAGIGLLGASLGTATAEPGADAAAVIKKKKRFDSDVNLNSVNLETNRATGTVDSNKRFCQRQRRVVLNGTGVYNEQIRANGRTNRNGDFSIGQEDLPPSGESYTVTAEKTVLKKVRTKRNGDKVKKKTICRPATSNVVSPGA